jgi:hypothetical protein
MNADFVWLVRAVDCAQGTLILFGWCARLMVRDER